MSLTLYISTNIKHIPATGSDKYRQADEIPVPGKIVLTVNNTSLVPSMNIKSANKKVNIKYTRLTIIISF